MGGDTFAVTEVACVSPSAARVTSNLNPNPNPSPSPSPNPTPTLFPNPSPSPSPSPSPNPNPNPHQGVMIEAALDTPLQIAEVEVFGYQLGLTPQSSVEVDLGGNPNPTPTPNPTPGPNGPNPNPYQVDLGGKVARRVQIFLSDPAQARSLVITLAVST